MEHTGTIKDLRKEIMKKAKNYQKELRIVYLATSPEPVKEVIKTK